VLDSVVIPNESVNLSPSWQLVYFGGGIRIRPHQDFHIGYAVAGEDSTNALAIVSDDGEPVGDERRSSGRWGQSWATMFARHRLDANFFIQAVVTSGDPPAWLGYDPQSGSLPAFATHSIDLNLDGSGLSDGIYKSGLIIDNDSPDPAVVFPVTFRVGQTAAGEEGSRTLPRNHALVGSYPNPFNARARIRYRVGGDGDDQPGVRMNIYNTLGQLVRRLVAGHQPPGEYDVRWDGRDDAARPVASGLYLCRLEVGEFRDVRKMILLR
jgi:hypothetical protein